MTPKELHIQELDQLLSNIRTILDGNHVPFDSKLKLEAMQLDLINLLDKLKH